MQPETSTFLENMVNMPVEDLKEIQARANFILGRYNNVAVDNVSSELFWDTLRGVAGKHNHKLPPYTQVQRSKLHKQVINGVDIIDKFIDENFPGITRARRAKVYRVMGECLLQELTRRGLPCNLATVAVRLKYVPEWLDNQFPGYTSAGVLSFIVG